MQCVEVYWSDVWQDIHCPKVESYTGCFPQSGVCLWRCRICLQEVHWCGPKKGSFCDMWKGCASCEEMFLCHRGWLAKSFSMRQLTESRLSAATKDLGVVRMGFFTWNIRCYFRGEDWATAWIPGMHHRCHWLLVWAPSRYLTVLFGWRQATADDLTLKCS